MTGSFHYSDKKRKKEKAAEKARAEAARNAKAEATGVASVWSTLYGEELSLWFRISAWYVSPTHQLDVYIAAFDDEEEFAKLTCGASMLEESHAESHAAQPRKFRKFDDDFWPAQKSKTH